MRSSGAWPPLRPRSSSPTQPSDQLEKPPSGPRWIHEIKHDGYRLQARRDAEGAYLITRNGFDWTERYAAIAAHLNPLACQSCIIDGEVVILDDKGAIPIFDRLRDGPRVKTEVYSRGAAGAFVRAARCSDRDCMAVAADVG